MAGRYFDIGPRDGGGGVSKLLSLVGEMLSIGEQVEGFRSRRRTRRESAEDRTTKRTRDDAEERRRDAGEQRATEDQDRELADAGYTRAPDAIADVDQRRSGLSPFRNQGERNAGRTVGRMLGSSASPEERREIEPFRRPGAPSVVRTGKSRQEERDATIAATRAENAVELERVRQEGRQGREGTWQRELRNGKVVYFNPVTQEVRDTDFDPDRTPDAEGGLGAGEREEGRAQSALQFAQSRRDRVVGNRPDPTKFTDDIGELDVPRFAGARKGYVSDSTRVERDLDFAEERASKAFGFPSSKARSDGDTGASDAVTAAARDAIAQIRASDLSDAEKATRIAEVNARLRKARGGDR